MRKTDLFHVLFANVAQQIIAFVGVLAIARLLPAEEFAQIRIAMAYMAVALILGAGGFTAPILRYCADPLFEADHRRRLLSLGLSWVFVISLLVVFSWLAINLATNRQGIEFFVLTIYALQIPALAATSLLLVYIQAVQRFKLLAFIQIGTRATSLLLTVPACYLFGLPGFLFATLAMAFLSVVPLLVAARPSFFLWGYGVPGGFYSLAGYSLLGMGITTVGQYADLMMLDWVDADKTDVAMYSLATIFFFAASALAGAVQGVATPYFTGLMTDRAGFRSSLLQFSIWLIAGGIAVAAGAFILAWFLEVFFLGPAYSGLSLMVALLMVRFCIWCSYAVGGAAMVGIGAIKQGTTIALFTTSLAIIAGYPLVLWYGVWGAGIAQVLVASLTAVLVFRVVVREVAKMPISE